MTAIPSTFPVQPTTFVGREGELTAIKQYLGDPACRLLTLVGAGGVGKTRLALEAGLAIVEDFDRGAAFINLQPVESADHLVSTIADTLDIPLSGLGEPQLQLFNYLADKEILLVLDNFEDLLAGAEFVTLLLQEAPCVKLIVTSRQALNLQEEWQYPVDGMSYPRKSDLEDVSVYSAVQFFVGCVQRLRPDFSLQEEQDGVVRICQLVNGLPLALEMAASWTKTLPCTVIADEIQSDIEFLKSNLRNIQPQHRSMQAVFDQSWKRLREDERSVFKRLSVFRGGFDLQAARDVAEATLSILSELVDKSILRVEAEGRYQIHELIRRYAQGKLAQIAQEEIRIQNLYGCHYIEFIRNLECDLVAGRQKEATLEVKSEFENIRKAWNWALENENIDAIKSSVMALSLFYQYQSRYVEGNRLLEDAERILRVGPPSQQRDLILVSVLCELGWLRIRLGKIDDSERGLLESIALMDKHNARPALAQCIDPRLPLGVIASIRGDSAETARLGEMVLHESESRGEIWNQQFSYYLLTRAALLEGNFESAQDYAQQTYQHAKKNQDHWFMVYCLNELGNVAIALDDYETAGGYFQASYELRSNFDDPEGMAVALNYLGEIALKGSDFQGAQEHFHHSREIYQEINDQGGLATSLDGMAKVALAEGNFVEARQCFLAALQISAEVQYLSLTTAILAGIAQLLIQVGETREVPRMLALVESHPASERETVDLVRRIARDYKIVLSPASEQSTDIEGVITHLLVSLPAMDLPAEPQVDVPSPSQPLIDPLTRRELEVLSHIADGLTNQQIAEKLIISPGTAKWYSSQIYSKLGVKNRTQAVARARELNLIQ